MHVGFHCWSVYEFTFNPAGSSVLKIPFSTVLNEQGKGTLLNFECANDGTGLSNAAKYFGACARTLFTVNQAQFYSIDLGARTVTKLPNIPLVNVKYRTGEFFDGLQYIPVNTATENAIYTVNLDTNATAKAFTVSDGAVYSIVKFTANSFK